MKQNPVRSQPLSFPRNPRRNWLPCLCGHRELHQRSTLPATPPFRSPWITLGTGYHNHPAFGHWDLIHATLDVLEEHPDHARNQLDHLFGLQQPAGFIPSLVYMNRTPPGWHPHGASPPVWVVAVQDLWQQTRDGSLLDTAYRVLCRQISWYDLNRSLPAVSAYFDIGMMENTFWDSGVDFGIRYDTASEEPTPAVDSTAWGHMLFTHARDWAATLGLPLEQDHWRQRAERFADFLRESCFDAETGFFHDPRWVGHPELRGLAIEGIWPLVTGAASPEQASRVIDENLMNHDRFFTPHPLASVGRADPKFSLTMWRGPTWNSMAYWAARGCLRYGRLDAAARILEAALDATARVFDQTGRIWEFYHPLGGSPLELQRKPWTAWNQPHADYLGHNPLAAMARLWGNCM
ncbi:MAG: glycoside hydrolase [Verrucomicrobia bacterium]|nr:glycoside hydrolase [Verrucomicrobiota bacterium]